MSIHLELVFDQNSFFESTCEVDRQFIDYTRFFPILPGALLALKGVVQSICAIFARAILSISKTRGGLLKGQEGYKKMALRHAEKGWENISRGVCFAIPIVGQILVGTKLRKMERYYRDPDTIPVEMTTLDLRRCHLKKFDYGRLPSHVTHIILSGKKADLVDYQELLLASNVQKVEIKGGSFDTSYFQKLTSWATKITFLDCDVTQIKSLKSFSHVRQIDVIDGHTRLTFEGELSHLDVQKLHLFVRKVYEQGCGERFCPNKIHEVGKPLWMKKKEALHTAYPSGVAPHVRIFGQELRAYFAHPASLLCDDEKNAKEQKEIEREIVIDQRGYVERERELEKRLLHLATKVPCLPGIVLAAIGILEATFSLCAGLFLGLMMIGGFITKKATLRVSANHTKMIVQHFWQGVGNARTGLFLAVPVIGQIYAKRLRENKQTDGQSLHLRTLSTKIKNLNLTRADITKVPFEKFPEHVTTVILSASAIRKVCCEEIFTRAKHLRKIVVRGNDLQILEDTKGTSLATRITFLGGDLSATECVQIAPSVRRMDYLNDSTYVTLEGEQVSKVNFRKLHEFLQQVCSHRKHMCPEEKAKLCEIKIGDYAPVVSYINAQENDFRVYLSDTALV